MGGKTKDGYSASYDADSMEVHRTKDNDPGRAHSSSDEEKCPGRDSRKAEATC